MNNYFVDLHIHIGRTDRGVPVKISAAKNLTFYNIAKEASERKGIDVVGIIDCQSPAVQDDIDACLESGEMTELAGGGIRYGSTTLLLGSEIEVRDPGMGPAHLLVYMPTLAAMKEFTSWIGRFMKNATLSTQRIYVPARVLQQEAVERGGILIPAHIFTPHKSVYGSCTDRMSELLDMDRIAAVELGLSADTEMAGGLSELDGIPFVTNSDAHSLGKIGREYNVMTMEEPNFEELAKALAGREGRSVAANFGLNPRLGKYHRTYCTQCNSILNGESMDTERCANCGSIKIVRGVMDRIEEIADREMRSGTSTRPAYHYQVPLEFIPGLGPKMMDKLLWHFVTEMNILHKASAKELAEIAGAATADLIVRAREGKLQLDEGGGGIYGKVRRDPNA